jgi:hypothetical protein
LPHSLPDLQPASCTEVYLDHTLEQIIYEQYVDFLKNTCTKLRIGGIIKISGYDLLSIAHDFTVGNLSLSIAQELLFAGQMMTCYADIQHILTQQGFQITKNRCEGYTYYVEAIRPKNTDPV